MKVNYNEITEGFEFNHLGRKVVIVSDYEKWNEDSKSVQIAYVDEPGKSAGQLSKLELFKILNKSISFREILKGKQDYYGKSEGSYEFAADEYATRKMIEENESILQMAETHMDHRAVLVLKCRITELKHMIGIYEE